MTTCRIEAGILGNLTDMDTTMTPFEAGLGAFVDMRNERFVGRGTLLDADRRPLLFGLKCAGATPTMGSLVVGAGKRVAAITAGARSPTLECGIGYVRFDDPGE